jgi:hypothetical protein
MKLEEEKNLERLLDRELKRLPDMPAPGSLVHRVMLAVHRRESLPWYRRAWPTWPAALQVSSILVLTVFVGGLMALTAYPEWLPGWSLLGSTMQQWTEPLQSLLAQGEALFSGLFMAVKAVGRQVLVFGLVLAGAGYFCSVALLTLGYRVVRRRIS